MPKRCVAAERLHALNDVMSKHVFLLPVSHFIDYSHVHIHLRDALFPPHSIELDTRFK